MQSTTIQNWLEEEFQPWQRSVSAIKEEQQQQLMALSKARPQLKAIVAALLDGDEARALELWNNIGLEPQLKDLEMDLFSGKLTVETIDAQVEELDLDQLLAQLQKII